MKTSFGRILAALDRSASSREVFNQALALAQQNHSRLILVHCTGLKAVEQTGILLDAGFGLVSAAKLRQLDEEHQDQVNEAYQWLCTYALEAQEQGICAEVVHQVGDASIHICHLAQQVEADLIVIGRSSQPLLKQRLFGSKSNHVALNAPCSVMLVETGSSVPRQSQLEVEDFGTKDLRARDFGARDFGARDLGAEQCVSRSHRADRLSARSDRSPPIPMASIQRSNTWIRY